MFRHSTAAIIRESFLTLFITYKYSHTPTESYFDDARNITLPYISQIALRSLYSCLIPDLTCFVGIII